MSIDHQNNKFLRVIHHWPCSGGTLISKCIASLSNIIFFNEIHPFAYLRLMKYDENQYLPTDIIQQLSFQRNGANSNLCNSAFFGAISEVNQTINKMNKILVIRDHSHIDFFVGPFPRKESLIYELFNEKYDLLRIFTVRHPLDSWLSTEYNNFHKSIQFNDFDEYCSRIKNMINSMRNVPLIHYEKFCTKPGSVFKIICEKLKIPFNASFLKRFNKVILSGDSGRKGEVIEPRERRTLSDELKRCIYNSKNYMDICNKLNYEYKYNATFPYLTN